MTAELDAARRLAHRLARTIRDERVLAAIAEVPRELFVPVAQRDRAYENVALPIACEQTISQPVVVARMLELLELNGAELVLDVGTGSGYHAALLGRLAREVWTIERHPELSRCAADALAQVGAANVTCVVGDGWRGLAQRAPFDAINVAATPGHTMPAALEEQLAADGRLVAPLGDSRQYLVRVRRTPDGLRRERLEPVRFVPLVQDEASS